MDSLETSIQIEVRSSDLDVLGHVNNAKYLEYLEWGREDWYEKAGFPIDRFMEMGIATVMVNVNLNYRKEARQKEELIIKTRPVKRGRTSFVLSQEIWKASGEVSADALVTSVIMDMKERRSVPLPPEFAAVFPEAP